MTIGLAEAIRSLRAELSQATAESGNSGLRFQVGPVELEFEVAVTKEASGSGGVRFWVVSAEGEASTTRTGNHRLKLELQPIVQNPETGQFEDARIADRVASRPN